MATTEERVDRMRDLTKDNFLIEASYLLNKSYGDDDVTDDEHKVLFEVFKETKAEKLPDPTSS